MIQFFSLLAGPLLAAIGGVALAYALWVDRFRGNHKRARCRKCWYELGIPADAPHTEARCPECGTVALAGSQLHRVRRNKPMLTVGALFFAGSLAVVLAPAIRSGAWFGVMPNWFAVRWWPDAGASEFGKKLTDPKLLAKMDPGTLKITSDFAQEYFSAKPRLAVQRAFDQVTAYQVLTLAQRRDDLAIARAKAWISESRGRSEPAQDYLKAIGFDFASWADVPESEIATTTDAELLRRNLQSIWEMARAGNTLMQERLLRIALADYCRKDPRSDGKRSFYTFGMLNSVLGEIANDRNQAAFVTRLVNAYRAAETEKKRDIVFDIFGKVLNDTRDAALLPFVFEVAAAPGGLERTELLLWRIGTYGWHLSPQQLGAMLTSGDALQVKLVVSKMTTEVTIPEGLGKLYLEAFVGPDGELPLTATPGCRKLLGPDRQLLIQFLDRGNSRTRNTLISIVSSFRPTLDEAVPSLLRIQADGTEPEEIRVVARDALRSMQRWPVP